jgi:predicted PurR-regulated permease PerM
MKITFRDKILLALLAIFLFSLFIYGVSEILLPFVMAIILSYFLSPAADRLEKRGTSRTTAVLIIIIIFFSALTVITAITAPLIYHQLMDMTVEIPKYISIANKKLTSSVNSIVAQMPPDTIDKAKESVGGFSGFIVEYIPKMLSGILDSGLALVNLFSLIFITPIVIFYILRDWHKIIAKIDTYLPPKYAPIIREQIKEIDNTLAGYIRGQTQVCVLLGTFYAVGLTLAGLNFGFLIGMATGILAFIPYVGLLFGCAIGLIVAFLQFGDMTNIAIIASIFIIGQVIEGNFVTPKLVGDKVGLHPVWVIFGMLAGGALLGFTGILLAVPLSAIIGVLIRFSLNQYLASPLFKNGKKPLKVKT